MSYSPSFQIFHGQGTIWHSRETVLNFYFLFQLPGLEKLRKSHIGVNQKGALCR